MKDGVKNSIQRNGGNVRAEEFLGQKKDGEDKEKVR